MDAIICNCCDYVSNNYAISKYATIDRTPPTQDMVAIGSQGF